MVRWQSLAGVAVAGVLATVGGWVVIYTSAWERYVGVGLIAVAVALVLFDRRY